MKRWIVLTAVLALFCAWSAAPALAAPQVVQEVKKKEARQKAGQERGKQEEAEEKAEEAEEQDESAEAAKKEGEQAGGIVWETGDPNAGPPKPPPGADIALLRKVANEEGRYRKRSAQIKRARTVATEKGDEKNLERIAELEKRNEAHHEKRIAQLREQHGDEQVDGAYARIENAGKAVKRGKGAEKAKEAREKTKEKGKEMKEKDKERAKDKVEKARGKKKKEGGE